MLLITPKGKRKETILKVNVRYIKAGDLDHVFSFDSVLYPIRLQTVYQITSDIPVVKTYISYLINISVPN